MDSLTALCCYESEHRLLKMDHRLLKLGFLDDLSNLRKSVLADDAGNICGFFRICHLIFTCQGNENVAVFWYLKTDTYTSCSNAIIYHDKNEKL